MVKHGKAPFLECSSKGDKRFSAFYAKLRAYNGKSIEEIYQSSKMDKNGNLLVNNYNSWRDCKGKKCAFPHITNKLYSDLWDLYFIENSYLLDVIKGYNGFSDHFGEIGHVCQSTEIYRIYRKTFVRSFE